jgi:hypothetical protein
MSVIQRAAAGESRKPASTTNAMTIDGVASIRNSHCQLASPQTPANESRIQPDTGPLIAPVTLPITATSATSLERCRSGAQKVR